MARDGNVRVPTTPGSVVEPTQGGTGSGLSTVERMSGEHMPGLGSVYLYGQRHEQDEAEGSEFRGACW